MGQAIYYTALPNGRSESGRYRVSISIDPRLNIGQDAKLSDFPDWVSWPETLAGVRDWGLRLITYDKKGGISTYEPANVTVETEFPLAPDLWKQLFPADTKVGAFKGPDRSDLDPSKGIIAPEETEVKNFLLDRIIGQARVLDPLTVEDQLKRYAPANLFEETKRGGFEIDKQLTKIAKKMDKRGAVAPSKGASPKRAMTLSLLVNTPSLAGLQIARRNRTEISARTVLNRAVGGPGQNGLSGQTGTPELDDIQKPLVRPKRPVVPELDFHQGLTGLGAHPELLRRLGLVVDLEFDLPADFAGISEANLKPSPKLALKDGQDIHPQPETRCIISGDRFEAAPIKGDPELDQGLVRLGLARYEINQVDLEGGAQQLISWVSELNRVKNVSENGASGVLAKFREPRPPSLRSAGLSVIRIGRAVAAQEKFDRQFAINEKLKLNSSNTIVELEREDITRGHIYDILDVSSGVWQSLCRRQGTARFGADSETPTPENGLALKADEGWISASLTIGFDPEDDLLRTQESIARWANGWSMVTPRPGKRLRDSETLDDGKQEVGNLKLAVSYKVVPGSLPAQRFGRTYVIRARAVDLGGNAISSEQADALVSPDHVLGPETYRRYEPVVPPTVIPRNPLSEGESPDVLVIRSNFDTAAADNDAPSQRHIFPPSIDQFRAETHGVFDAPSGPDPEAYARIVARADGAFDARSSNGSFVHASAIPDPRNYGAPYFDTDDPKFNVEATSAPADMPSLPDPMATGYAFFGLPGGTIGGFIPPYSVFASESAKWPDIRSIRLVVSESKSFVRPFLEGDELRIGLPKGEMFEVKLSSGLREADLDQLGIWGELVADGSAAALKSDVINGRHWAITPSRTLRLIHAVRQPLVPTEFTSGLELIRAAGENFVTVEDEMTTSRKSTERVDVSANWTEIFDVLTRDPKDPDEVIWEPRKQVERASAVFTAKIDLDPAGDGTLPVDEPHQLHTTRHIPDISYTTISTTRFKEYFTERKVLNFSERSMTETLPTSYTGPAAGGPGVVPDSEKVTSMDGKTVYKRITEGVRGGHYTLEYGRGTITRQSFTNKKGTIFSMPDTVRATYLTEKLTRESVKPKLARAVSAARPDPPKVLYAVPTFKRELVDTKSEKRALHEPVGLRVYLDRPWWSSGADEMLGVVCWPALGVKFDDKTVPSDALAPNVTQRGQDPIWGGAPTDRHVRPTDFTAEGVVTDTDLVLQEAPGELVAVAGHEVHEDLGTRRWFCDIDILPGSAYTPFIKLALARYQQHSVPGVELSAVVPLSFMQLYPSRTATVVPSGSTISVAVSGRTYRKGGDTVPGLSVIRAQVEARRPEMPDGDDAVGWMPTSDTIQLTAQTGSDGITTWLGSFTGLNLVLVNTRRRVVIREYEQFARSDSKTVFDERLVYAEGIKI